MTLFTIGHSIRPLDEFISMLEGRAIQHLIDVRTVPRSRHNPQFNRETLPAALHAHGIDYTHQPGLGGLRPQRRESINTGWHNASFRAYADYMQTEEFADNIARLIALGQDARIAMMCAEAVPWRCHRSLIADALLVRGIAVEEIVSAEKSEAHRLTPFARVDGTRITYPPDEPANRELF
jgi:uncharacterized protein (DUF488 family)